MREKLFSEPVRKAAAITALGILGAGTVIGIKEADEIAAYFAPSPEEIIANANEVFDESGVRSDQCYPGTMGQGGVTGDLIDEIQHNENLDINKLHGFSDAGEDINDVLSAKHEISDTDHNSIAQTGDRYEYCTLDDGTVILGNPRNYIIVSR